MNTIETLKTILRNNKMSTRPEYYSGRGATLCDLNNDILFGIHKDIKISFGEKEAKAFVQMVKKIKVMSATTFIQELYMLYDNNWKISKSKDAAGVVIPKDKNGNYNVNAGVFGMAHALFSGDRDDTQAIKSHFLRVNGVKGNEVYNSSNGTVTMYF